jgi:hypothetical protein
MRAPKVVAVIRRDNHRSLRLFARFGFTPERAGQWTRHALALKDYLKIIQGGNSMQRELVISRIDRERLNRLIEDALYGVRESDPSYRALQREIGRARVMEPQALPRTCSPCGPAR